VDDPLRDGHRLELAGDVLAEHGELVAAGAGDRVLGADRGLQAPGQLEQQLVAAVVAERVVDSLEAVDVEEEDGDGPGAAAGSPPSSASRAASRTSATSSGSRWGNGEVPTSSSGSTPRSARAAADADRVVPSASWIVSRSPACWSKERDDPRRARRLRGRGPA